MPGEYVARGSSRIACHAESVQYGTDKLCGEPCSGMLEMYDSRMTNAIPELKPWVAWPAIAKAARTNGWRVLAERRGVAWMERHDPRSEVGAVALHVEFNRGGYIAGAWIEELDRNIRSQPKMLNTILQWISEAVPVKPYGAVVAP